LPKGMCMRNVTQVQCDHIADDLNNRPRKRHNFKTPAALYLRSQTVLHLLVESSRQHYN